jgi:hypothetical protein
LLLAVPGSSDIGISFAELLQPHLDGHPATPAGPLTPAHASLTGDASPTAAPSTDTTTDTNILQDLDWETYLATLTDVHLVGSWEFGYWDGAATFVPAPYAKGFSTLQLQHLLSPEVVLASLDKGVWGRALMAATNVARVTADGQQAALKHADVAAGGGPAAAAAAPAASTTKKRSKKARRLQLDSSSSSDELVISVALLAQLYAAAALVAQGGRKSILLQVA